MICQKVSYKRDSFFRPAVLACPPQTARRHPDCREQWNSLMWIRAVKDGKRQPKAIAILRRPPKADRGGLSWIRGMRVVCGGNMASSGLWGVCALRPPVAAHSIVRL